MDYRLLIALRQLRSKKRDAFLSIITIISVVGISLGVATMIVVLSVMSGFSEDLKSKVLGNRGHISLMKYGQDFVEYRELAKKIEKIEGVVATTPVILTEAMVVSSNNMSGVVVLGIDPNSIGRVTDLSKEIKNGDISFLKNPGRIPGNNPDSPDPGIVIGKELAASLFVDVGDTISLVNPVGDTGPFGTEPKGRRFRIAGIFYSGMYEYDLKFVYILLKEAQSFFDMPDRITHMEIKIKDPYESTEYKDLILKKAGGYPYHVMDWKDFNRNLFSALKLEKLAMFFILIFIILVASFNIASTLFMTILAKQKEIAILRSLGESMKGIARIFMFEGMIIGVSGTMLGLGLGLLFCWLIEEYGIKLNPEIYYIEKIPVIVNWIEVVAICTSALLISFISTIYPALRASRLRPTEGLRYD